MALSFEDAPITADDLLEQYAADFEDADCNVCAAVTVSDTATFDDLCEIEPALRDLESQIREVDGSDAHFCANAVWSQVCKATLVSLVGWDARRPGLRTQAAYDTAYDHLYNLLPLCRDCWCI